MKRKSESQPEAEKERKLNKENQSDSENISDEEDNYENEAQDREGELDTETKEFQTNFIKLVGHQHSITKIYDRAKLEKYNIDYNYYNFEMKPLIEKRGELIEKLPKFWIGAIVGHSELSQQIGSAEIDIPLFESMKDIKITIFPPKVITEDDEYDEDDEKENNQESKEKTNGFRVEFILNPNSIISDQILWKEFYYSPFDIEQLVRIEQSGVHWIINKKKIKDFSSFFSVFENTSNIDEQIFLFVKEELYIDPVLYNMKSSDVFSEIENDSGDDSGDDNEN